MKTFPADKLVIRNGISYLCYKTIVGLFALWMAYDFWAFNSWFWYLVSILFLGVGSYFLYGSSMELITRKAVLILSPKGVRIGEKQFFSWECISTEIITRREGRLFRFSFKIFSSPTSSTPYKFLAEISIDGIGMPNKDLEDAIQFYRRGGVKESEG